jgi:hypothetical protein
LSALICVWFFVEDNHLAEKTTNQWQTTDTIASQASALGIL